MTYRVRIIPQAERDIDRLFLWIAKRAPEGAATWYRRLQEVLESLRTSPLSGSLAPEHLHLQREIRDLNFKTRRGRMYRLLYEVQGNEVLVLHGRGPGQRLLNEDEVRRE